MILRGINLIKDTTIIEPTEEAVTNNGNKDNKPININITPWFFKTINDIINGAKAIVTIQPELIKVSINLIKNIFSCFIGRENNSPNSSEANDALKEHSILEIMTIINIIKNDISIILTSNRSPINWNEFM